MNQQLPNKHKRDELKQQKKKKKVTFQEPTKKENARDKMELKKSIAALEFGVTVPPSREFGVTMPQSRTEFYVPQCFNDSFFRSTPSQDLDTLTQMPKETVTLYQRRKAILTNANVLTANEAEEFAKLEFIQNQEQQKLVDTKLKNVEKRIVAKMTALEQKTEQQLMTIQEQLVQLTHAVQQIHRHGNNVEKSSNRRPQNCWDVNTCQNGIELIDTEFLTVRYQGNGNMSSVFSKYPVQNGIYCSVAFFYYELSILKSEQKCCAYFGLAPKQSDQIVDTFGCIAYRSDGFFWFGNSWLPEKQSFTAGDTVGCGLNLSNGQIIFTKNGQRLDTTGLVIPSPTDGPPLFPCVSLCNCGDTVKANFGPSFHFDFASTQ
ncbi:hypothetical protein niasHT_034252 [Heterodera trifolii]|uniref:B30.2/SPRY domain-containing protein n=1 Tax=Heterodera trifolii TaxID=157864 RepID=A0ABD2INE8_9BILA